MKLSELLPRGAIAPALAATTKAEVLRELAGVLHAARPEIDAADLARVLAERERLGSTGLEDGVAIPHGKLKGLAGLAGAFGRSAKGVEFGSIDRKPTTLFFLLVAPEGEANLHLRALSQIVKAAKEDAFRRALTRAKGAAEIVAAIRKADERLAQG
jgi:PTS system nitrogen regulatory IIA component